MKKTLKKEVFNVLVDTYADRLRAYCTRKSPGSQHIKKMVLEYVGQSYSVSATVVWRVLVSSFGKPRVSIIKSIGDALSDEGTARYLSREKAWTYKQLTSIHGKSGKTLRRHYKSAPKLSTRNKTILGMICYELAIAGGALSERREKIRGKYYRVLEPSEELEQYLKTVPSHPVLRSPSETLSAPVCWEPGQEGGIPTDHLAKLGRQAYRASGEVLEVARSLYRLGSPLFPPVEPLPVPKRRDYTDLQEYKRRSHWIHDTNRKLKTRRVNYLSTFTSVADNVNKESFYFRTFADKRGRCYYDPLLSSTQGNEVAQASLLFKTEDEINEEVRHRYAQELCPEFDEAMLRDIRKDPVGSRHLWEHLRKPWLFLQLCLHWDDPGVPVSLDASNHGLQLMSVLANHDLDKTKVQDTGIEPEDIYLLIGNRVRPGIDRDVWKRPIMTLPYGSNKHSWVWQLFSVESKENPGTYMFSLQECWQIARKLEREIKKELPWAMNLLKLFRTLGQKADTAVSWRVPAGYSVEQHYRAFEYRKCASRLHGGVTTTLYSVQKDEPARRANSKALTPNIIQSLDASLLCSFIRQWDHPISVAHDRFSTSSFHLSALYQQLQQNAEVMLNRADFLKTLVADITGDDSYELPFEVPEYERWNISPYFYSF